MRILHCTSRLSQGGAERQLAYLSRHQARMGHEVFIAFLYDGPDLSQYRDTNISMIRLNASHNHDPFLIFRLLSLMRRIKPDVVTSWVLQMDVLAGLAASCLSIPWVLREPASRNAWPMTLKNGIRVMVARTASAILSNSKGGDHFWQDFKPSSKRYVVSNALPLAEMRAVEPAHWESLKPPVAPPIVLYAGRLADEQKNLSTMISAFVDVAKDVAATLIICGDGPDRKQLQMQAEQLEMGNRILFLGHVPATEIWSWMKRAEVFVFVSHYEGQPNAVLEAMACACPLVVSNIPAHREVLDDSMAIFVDSRDASQIRQAIATSLQDRPGATRRAETARRAAQRYSIEKTAEEYMAIYNRILDKDQQAPSS